MMESGYSEEAYDSFLLHMPDFNADEALVVLKGHLLVEVILREFVDARVFRGEKHPSFKFGGLLWLVRANLGSGRQEPWIWAAADSLNNLRNAYAHELQSPGVPSFRTKFLKLVADGMPEVEAVANVEDDDGRLFRAIFGLYISMLDILDPRRTLDVLTFPPRPKSESG